MRWASYEKPAIFYSIVLGSLGPVALFTLPPIRRYFGDVDPAEIPFSYPGTLPAPLYLASFIADLCPPFLLIVPAGPRKIPQGYDDE